MRLVLVALLLAACAATAPGAASPTVGPLATPAITAAAVTAAPTAYTPRPGATDVPLPSGPILEFFIELSDDGTYLVDMDGYSFYTFDEDPPGEASCLGTCADNWPPVGVLAPFQVAVAGDGVGGTLGLIERDDVALTQVMYNDHALYYYDGDAFPGDTNGDGIGDVWHLATP